MMPDSGPMRDPSVSGGDPLAEIRRLRDDLLRMRAYAQALEERCNRLWTYVPDTHGDQDPVLPFVALHCHMMATRNDELDQATA